MCIIVTYNETGGQEEGPKCKDVLKLLMSNARALETPKKKRRGQAGLYPSSMRNSKLYWLVWEGKESSNIWVWSA